MEKSGLKSTICMIINNKKRQTINVMVICKLKWRMWWSFVGWIGDYGDQLVILCKLFLTCPTWLLVSLTNQIKQKNLANERKL